MFLFFISKPRFSFSLFNLQKKGKHICPERNIDSKSWPCFHKYELRLVLLNDDSALQTRLFKAQNDMIKLHLPPLFRLVGGCLGEQSKAISGVMNVFHIRFLRGTVVLYYSIYHCSLYIISVQHYNGLSFRNVHRKKLPFVIQQNK